MKYLIFLSICLITSLATSAKIDRSILRTDQLKVISIKPQGSVVKIDNNQLFVGQTITASTKLSWEKGGHYIIVYNKRTNVKHRFCSNEFASNTPTLYGAYVKRNSASSKGISEKNAVDDMKSLFERNHIFYMIEDEIYINSTLINDSTHYFELTVLSVTGDINNITLPYNSEEPFTIGIFYQLLLKAGVDIAKQPVRCALTYCTPDEEIPLTNDFWIEYIKP